MRDFDWFWALKDFGVHSELHNVVHKCRCVPLSPCQCCTRTDFTSSCQACGETRPDPLHRARRQLERKVRHTATLQKFQHPNRLEIVRSILKSLCWHRRCYCSGPKYSCACCIFPEAGKSLSRWCYCPCNWEGKGQAKGNMHLKYRYDDVTMIMNSRPRWHLSFSIAYCDHA